LVLVLAVVIGPRVMYTAPLSNVTQLQRFEFLVILPISIFLMCTSQDRLHHNHETLPSRAHERNFPVADTGSDHVFMMTIYLTSTREENNHIAQSTQDAGLTAGRWRSKG